MPPYRVFVAAEVIAFLRTYRRQEQILITQLFDSLAKVADKWTLLLKLSSAGPGCLGHF